MDSSSRSAELGIELLNQSSIKLQDVEILYGVLFWLVRNCGLLLVEKIKTSQKTMKQMLKP
ncbi:uncharacterized protein M6B38_123385 [Iris pallida]|uniref:Uncharacterized protein n=1 Tax=Iris pallida TaxID=29817 RepID=A0AAX6H213_IRIPA|nr:uncharacterized protein M6B38_123385 [Iris pallida]